MTEPSHPSRGGSRTTASNSRAAAVHPEAECHLDGFCDELASRLRHSTETQARLAVRNGCFVLFDRHHRAAAQSERQREEAGTRIQVEHRRPGWDGREHLLHEDLRRAHVRLKERRW